MTLSQSLKAYKTNADRHELQVLLPLVQGMIWTLAMAGWRYWNRNTQLSGSSIGVRIRRWWWRTNNWPIEDKWSASVKRADEVGDVSSPWGFKVGVHAWLTNFLQYYTTKLGAGGD